MIDGRRHDVKRGRMTVCEGFEEVEKGGGIAAAGNRDEDRLPVAQVEGREERVRVEPHRGPVGQQEVSCFSCSTRSFSASDICG
jgi:hypothetical protein